MFGPWRLGQALFGLPLQLTAQKFLACAACPGALAGASPGPLQVQGQGQGHVPLVQAPGPYIAAWSCEGLRAPGSRGRDDNRAAYPKDMVIMNERITGDISSPTCSRMHVFPSAGRFNIYSTREKWVSWILTRKAKGDPG